MQSPTERSGDIRDGNRCPQLWRQRFGRIRLRSNIAHSDGKFVHKNIGRQCLAVEAAVSKVIRNAYGVSPAMRERVESAIDQLGYRPRVAARVMRGASFTIGFEVPHLGNDFFTQVTQGAATSQARPRGPARSS